MERHANGGITMLEQIKQYLSEHPDASKRDVCRKLGIGREKLGALVAEGNIKFKKTNHNWMRKAPLIGMGERK